MSLMRTLAITQAGRLPYTLICVGLWFYRSSSMTDFPGDGPLDPLPTYYHLDYRLVSDVLYDCAIKSYTTKSMMWSHYLYQLCFLLLIQSCLPLNSIYRLSNGALTYDYYELCKQEPCSKFISRLDTSQRDPWSRM